MITSITNYTDVHGITHDAPIFVLRSVRASSTSNENYEYDIQNDTYNESIQESNNINYSVQYWPSQAAFDANNRPLDFFNVNGEGSFYFNPATNPANVLTAAEDHFINEVI